MDLLTKAAKHPLDQPNSSVRTSKAFVWNLKKQLFLEEKNPAEYNPQHPGTQAASAASEPPLPPFLPLKK